MIHHSYKLSSNVIDDLFHKKVIHASTYKVLKVAELCGGYISGGFATVFSRTLYDKKNVDHWCYELDDGRDRRWTGCNYIKDYLGYRMSISQVGQLRPWWKVGNGDIDVWFENEEQIANFAKYSERIPRSVSGVEVIVSHKTPLETGYEFICFDHKQDNGQIIQAITKYYGDPATITKSFDIYNAACYIKNNEVFVPDEWEWLELNRMLHVQNATSEYIFSRIAKWNRKHHFINLTPFSIQLINDCVQKLIDSVNDNLDKVKIRNLLNKCVPFLDNISLDKLLFLTAMFPDGSYSKSSVAEAFRNRVSNSIA